MDPQTELAARYGYCGTIDVDRSPLRATIDDFLIMLASERLSTARLLSKRTSILTDNAADTVAGRAGSALACGQVAVHIGELAILDMVISSLVALADRVDGLTTTAVTAGGTQYTAAGLDRATAAFRQLVQSLAPVAYDRERVKVILAMASGPSRRTALLTAVQDDQVIVGAYASVPVIMGLVAEGLGEAIHDEDHVGRIIGFKINDRGRTEAARLDLESRCTRDDGCPVHPDDHGPHSNAMRVVEY